MNKKAKLALSGLILSILGIGFYFTPHLAVYNMKKAAENKDADALSSYVDYVSLKESLKANFNAKMASEVIKNQTENPFGAFGAALAAALINPMIDAFVTPESLAMLMKGNKPELDKSSGESTNKAKSDETDNETSMLYKGLNRFVVKVKKKGNTEDPVEFIFKRDGFISWKLTSLHLP